MKYIKDNIVYTPPIRINKDINIQTNTENGIELVKKNVTIYTNDNALILEDGYKEYIEPKPAIDILIQESDDAINKQTDLKILNEFTYKDNEFYLTIENQINFKAMYDLKDSLTYPVTIKTKTGFMKLLTKEDVSEFYLAGFEFIKQCIEEGWVLKENAKNQIISEY